MTDVNIRFAGYNSITQGYNEGGYNQDVAFTGLASALGSVSISIVLDPIQVTGEEASASAGNTTETAGGGISVGVTGSAVTASINSVNVWTNIVPSQSPSWTNINVSQTPNWENITARAA